MGQLGRQNHGLRPLRTASGVLARTEVPEVEQRLLRWRHPAFRDSWRARSHIRRRGLQVSNPHLMHRRLKAQRLLGKIILRQFDEYTRILRELLPAAGPVQTVSPCQSWLVRTHLHLASST